jgi:hypothetical protein
MLLKSESRVALSGEKQSLFFVRILRKTQMHYVAKDALLKYESKGGIFTELLAVERTTSMLNNEI